MNDSVIIRESPEERELRKRNATAKRIKILSTLVVLSVMARLLIKDPPAPKIADYSKDVVRVIPGMLDALPASERAKLDPKLVAQMQLADATAKYGNANASMVAKTPYKPAEAPLEVDAEAEAYKQQLYAYAKKRRNRERKTQQSVSVDLTKGTLVQFRSGGYIKAEKIIEGPDRIEIQYDGKLLAGVPKKFVQAVMEDSATWEAPVPDGCVRLKPAPGITITVGKKTAERISIQKPSYDEI